MTWFKGGVRFLLVTVGIIVLTSLGIDASQNLTGSSSALGILADRATEGSCPDGMVFIESGTEDFCIDMYEASPGAGCPMTNTTKTGDTATNVLASSCVPHSVANAMPWRFVSLVEAQTLCARAGKRLPKNEEWHRASLRLGATEGCVINEREVSSTGVADCASADGVHDLVGNVWEWIDESIDNGRYNERTLPQPGYVLTVDNNGLVVETSDIPQSVMGEDYAWTNTNGTFGMIRGGFYSNGTDAGIFAQNLAVDLGLRTNGIGFRCVQDV